METATMAYYGVQVQEVLFGNLVVHHFSPQPQPKEERLEVREEVEALSRHSQVIEVHTHNDPLLDVLDVIERLADALSEIKPSADPQHRKPSLKECLKKLTKARWELDDAIQVVCTALKAERVNVEKLPCLQAAPPPIFQEIT
ncbi:MAG: hypothetical protein JNN25_08630 [Candidatus Kapabacteria bacterium]|nr:hypothetical protein [Candidatus Kapabacteria bacterium]